MGPASKTLQLNCQRGDQSYFERHLRSVHTASTAEPKRSSRSALTMLVAAIASRLLGLAALSAAASATDAGNRHHHGPHHNGGFVERPLSPHHNGGPGGPARQKPHVLFVLWDDFGWAGAGYNRAAPSPEVRTPTSDALVAEGILFEHSYVSGGPVAPGARVLLNPVGRWPWGSQECSHGPFGELS